MNLDKMNECEWEPRDPAAMIRREEKLTRGVFNGWTSRTDGRVWYWSPPGYSCGFLTTTDEAAMWREIEKRRLDTGKNGLVWC